MKLSQGVFYLLAILVVLVKTDGVRAKNNLTDLRRTSRNKTRVDEAKTKASNSEVTNAESDELEAILNKFVTKISTSKEANATQSIDISTDVGTESENLAADELETIRYRDLVQDEGLEQKPINNSQTAKNAAEIKNNNNTKGGNNNKNDTKNPNKNVTVPKNNTKVGNNTATVSKTESEVKNESGEISKTVAAGGGNRMSELRNKFLSRSQTRKQEPSNSTGTSTIVIAPNDVDDFKRNFQNSPKFKDTIFEPVLTTVIKTKTVLINNELITVTEKNFLYHRDQTEPPRVSRVTNTTTYTNNQQYASHEIQHLLNDRYTPDVLVASKRGADQLLPASCAELMKQKVDAPNGVYSIYVFGYGPTDVYCFADPVSKGCAWTVFMRRVNIGDLFNKNWRDYKYGFGELDKSFFLGLDRIYAQTSFRRQELGIFTKFETNDIEVEKYAYFSLGGPETAYRVEELGEFSRTSAICRLTRFSKFSTQDVDSGYQYDKCAQTLGMGWWYSERCKSAIKLSGVRAYINAPTIMGLRPTDCRV